MKKFSAGMGIAILVAGTAFAQAPAKSTDARQLTPQQQRMKDCNATAGKKNLAGEARKQFMSSCLSGSGAAATMTQQEKMTYCSQEAGTRKLSGDEREKFMSGCLSG